MLIEIGSDNTVQLSGLVNEKTGVIINDGAVTFELTDLAGLVIASGPMSYVAASSGVYQGAITAAVSVNLADYEDYRVNITALKDGLTLYKRLVPTARYGD